jgi:hypothetical protein
MRKLIVRALIGATTQGNRTDVTVKKPRTSRGVVGYKSEGDVVQSGTDVDDVATNGVDIAATGTSYHVEYALYFEPVRRMPNFKSFK